MEEVEALRIASPLIGNHVRAFPLVEVHSVSIETRHHVSKKKPPPPSKHHEIYGKICVVDTREDGSELLSLFDKVHDNPEFIKSKASLLLNRSSRIPIIASKYTRLRLHLFDKKANNMIVAKKDIVLNKTGCQLQEPYEVDIDDGEGGMTFARVRYTIFQYAVTATVHLVYFSKDDNTDEIKKFGFRIIHDDENTSDGEISYSDLGKKTVASVRGSVSVRVRSHDDGHDIYPTLIPLFESGDKGALFKSGNFIPLSRSVVVLPVYTSSLDIKMDLSRLEGDTWKMMIAKGVSHSIPQMDYTSYDLVGDNGDCIRVFVDWRHNKRAMFSKARRHITEGPFQARFPVNLVEVFSVVVYCKDFKSLKVYGTVDVADFFDNLCCVFRKTKECPQFCPEPPFALAELKPSVVEIDDYMEISVDLKDAETEAEISNGFAPLDCRPFLEMLNVRLCSIVFGKQGFAVLHYTVFSDAVFAILDLKLYSKGFLPGYVNGKVVARYSTYDYSTEYEKKYYSITLFDSDSVADKDSQQAIENGSSLKLLKPEVILPRNTTLIIESNLSISASRGVETSLKNTVKLKSKGVSDFESRARLIGRRCHIEIRAVWRLDLDF